MDEDFYIDHSFIDEEVKRPLEALWWIDQGLALHPDSKALRLRKASILMDSFDDVEEAFSLLLTVEKSLGHQSIEQIKSSDPDLLLELYLLLTDCFRLKSNFREA